MPKKNKANSQKATVRREGRGGSSAHWCKRI